METMFQIFAVLTKNTTHYLYRKNELNVRPTVVEENEEGETETSGSCSNPDQENVELSNATLKQSSSRAEPSRQSQTQHIELSESNIARSKSLDSIASGVFERLLELLEEAPADQDSDASLDRTLCRICYGTQKENLLQICNCKGTIAHVHVECIERWLQECGVDTCDLCKYKFITIRKPTQSKFKSFVSWLKHVDNQDDMEDLVSDITATFLCSPFIILLTLSGYQAVSSNAISMFVPDTDEKLVLSLYGTASMFTLFTIVTVVSSISLSWLCFIGHKHYSRWHSWYSRSSTVKLVLPENIGRDTS